VNKSELVARIAELGGFTKKDTERFLEAFTSVIEAALKSGDKVQLIGFGSFEVRQRGARKGMNPQTKKEIVIPATKAPTFKAGKQLKDAVNG
jgi:DNA-binding protein HU-beta